MTEGRFDQETVFADDPSEMAARWSVAGAEYLHVVDLDGALAGTGRNLPAIKNPGARFYASAGRRRDQKSGSSSRIAGTGGQPCDSWISSSAGTAAGC